MWGSRPRFWNAHSSTELDGARSCGFQQNSPVEGWGQGNTPARDRDSWAPLGGAGAVFGLTSAAWEGIFPVP